MKTGKVFRISRKPLVPLGEEEASHPLIKALGLPRFDTSPRLFAIARDPWTIFVYWSVDWPSIFKNRAPIDRQVHFRLHSADGLEEKEAAVEPMAGMHYLKMSQRHRACRLEIGYYQPADVWHSVVMSNEIMIPPTKTAEADDADLATVPFHLRFQQLVDLFGAANNEALTLAISRFQTREVSSGSEEKLSSEQRETLRRVGIAPSALAEARRAFGQIDSKKLKRDAKTRLRSGPTSPSRGFKDDWISAGS